LLGLVDTQEPFASTQRQSSKDLSYLYLLDRVKYFKFEEPTSA